MMSRPLPHQIINTPNDQADEPTAHLRFVERDGKRILQQLWGVFDVSALPWRRSEWRDVPLSTES